MTQVQQGSQSRSFTYDALSRLKQAINPESGTINYTYDSNGNLETKTDARSVVTTFTYDGLNRVLTRTYSGAAPGGTTPGVSYSYDNAAVTNSKGRLTSVSSSVSSYSYGSYDVMGRVETGMQATDGQNYPMSYQYNLAGEMTSETYPSGRVVVTEYDSAGRVAGVKNQATGLYWAGATPTDVTNRIQYAAHGAVSVMKLGNGLLEHTNFNSRMQPTQIGLGTTSVDSSKLRLDYGYGSTSNNGNVLTQRIVISSSLDVTQTYTYDTLNRLSTASEGISWTQNYDYDRYGNRAVNPSSTLIPNASLTPRVLTDFSTTTNRITLSNFAYDAAGNLKSDPTATPNPPNGMIYDAENRQTSYTKSGVTTTYAYDGDGRRVKKIDSNGTTVFVYDVGSQVIAEYHSDPVPPAAGGGGTSYLTRDHLGSTRVVTKADGTVKARYDYLPFGEEIPSTVGSRSSVVGYSAADSTKQKFTSKERDTESGLDYFLARYYSAAQGRFTSPDDFDGNPASLSNDFERSSALPYAMLLNPQTFNQYAYVENNPLSHVDPDGHAGRKQPLPGNSRYQIRVDRSNLNDAPNIHVFDKGGRREIGRVAIKPGQYEWTGKVPESVKAEVQSFAQAKGITPRLPGRGSTEGGAAGEGPLGARGRGLRGSNSLVLLSLISIIVDAWGQRQDAQNLGYHVNFAGQAVIDDLNKAAHSFGEGAQVSFRDPSGRTFVFQVTKGKFVTKDPGCPGCELIQDDKGNLYVGRQS